MLAAFSSEVWRQNLWLYHLWKGSEFHAFQKLTLEFIKNIHH